MLDKKSHVAVCVTALFAAATWSCGSDSGHENTGGSSSTSTTSGTTTSGTSTTSGTTTTGTTTSTSSGTLVTFGEVYSGGQFHLGPVDYAESAFHNACAPGTKYAPQVQQAEGVLLAGLWDGIPNVASYCDACIWVTTAKGKSAMLRVVTYGATSSNSIDTSPEAYGLLDSGEYPREMTWQFAKCSDTGPMMYEFQTGANEWWTSLWVRNARVPIAKVEVQSANHGAFVELQRGGDGTLTDGSGFGAGSFTLRTTGIDGQTVVETFDWPSGGIAGAMLSGKKNFE